MLAPTLAPNSRLSPGKGVLTPGVKLDIPENLQVGAYSGCRLHNKNNIGPCQSVLAAAATFYGDGGDKYSPECWGVSPPQQRDAVMGAALPVSFRGWYAGKHRLPFVFLSWLCFMCFVVALFSSGWPLNLSHNSEITTLYSNQRYF